MKIGAHLSIKGELSHALEDAVKIKANTLQIFSGPPRSWLFPRRSEKELEKFRRLAKKRGISPVFIHAKYLINLASPYRSIREKSIRSLREDLSLAKKIGAQGVIFHPHPKNLSLLLKNLAIVLPQIPSQTFLILENSAQMKLETIGKIIHQLSSPQLKFCLDTAHAFEAGYRLPQALQIIKEKIGFQNLVAIHINDSQTPQGSFHDQHADIGKGKINPEEFFVLLNLPFTKNLPFILETPAVKKEGLAGDRKNIQQLLKLQGKVLKRDFFLQNTVDVAKKLLGKYLIINRHQRFQIGKIVETEAYCGPDDKASHASRGKTPRTKIMFGPPGKLYVYLIYGMYHCLNIVTEKKGYPAAVLIRAIEPVWGIQGKTDGPGKLCRELAIKRTDTDLDITSPRNGIYLKDIGLKPKKIIATPRIGVDYAGEWAKKKWRFVAQF